MKSRQWDVLVILIIAIPQLVFFTSLIVAALVEPKWLVLSLFLVGNFCGLFLLSLNYFLARRILSQRGGKKPGTYETVIGIAFSTVLGPVFLYYSPILRRILQDGKKINTTE